MPVYKYSEDTIDAICLKTATSAKSLKTIAKEVGLSPSTILDWLTKHQSFAEKYARAKEHQADYLAEEILEIADDSSKDTLTFFQDGIEKKTEDKEWTNRSKLRVDARKWVASKLKPKKYSDQIKVDQTVHIEQPLFPDVPANDSD